MGESITLYRNTVNSRGRVIAQRKAGVFVERAWCASHQLPMKTTTHCWYWNFALDYGSCVPEPEPRLVQKVEK